MPRQLKRVRSQCPLYLVMDDATWTSMAASDKWRSHQSKLIDAYGGQDRIIMLSSLRARAGFTAATHAALSSTTARVAAQTIKIWLFALPSSQFRRVALLDLDLLITRNIDTILVDSMVGTASSVVFASAPMPNCTPHGVPVFNSGLFVFRPSVDTLHALMVRLRFSMDPWLGAMPSTIREQGRVRSVSSASILASSWPAWVDECAPISALFGGRNASGDAIGAHRDCLLPSCLRARRLFPSAKDPLDTCRRHFNGEMAPSWKRRAFADAVCEPKLTDQSLLNWHAWCEASHRWRPCVPREHPHAAHAIQWLPLSFNTKWNGKTHGPTLKECPADPTAHHRPAYRQRLAALPAVLHFHGPAKPWSKIAKGVTTAGRVWQRWCERTGCVPETLT